MIALSTPPDPHGDEVLQPDGRYYDVRGFFLFGKFFTYLVYFDGRWKPVWFLGSFNMHTVLLLRKQGHNYRYLITLVWLFVGLVAINILLKTVLA